MTAPRGGGSAGRMPPHHRLMRRSPHTRLTLVAPLLWAAACDEPLGSAGPEAGTYVAVSANGAPLPYTYYESAQEVLRLRADTIVLDGRGHATRRLRTEATRNGLTETYEKPQELWYRLDGESFVIGWPGLCDDTAVCLGPDEGSLHDGEIRLRPSWMRDTEVRLLRVER